MTHWLTDNAVWVATREGWFAYASAYEDEDQIPVGKPCRRRHDGGVVASLQKRSHLAELFAKVNS